MAKSLLRCEQQYTYRFIRGLTPKRTKRTLLRGGWLHALLETHYSGGDWRERHGALLREHRDLLADDPDDEYLSLPTDIVAVMENYFWTWRKEDMLWRIVAVEQKFVQPLDGSWDYAGRTDLIIDHEGYGGKWLVEHKTVSRMLVGAERRLMDPQTHRYYWALQKQYKLRGVIFNYLQAKPPTVPEQLKNGELTQRQNLDTNWYTYAQALKRLKLDPAPYRPFLEHLRKRDEKFFRRVRVPRNTHVTELLVRDLSPVVERIELLESGRRPPLRAIDFRCETDCAYLQLCLTELEGGDGEAVSQQMFEEGYDAYTEALQETEV